jgi:hypothetical protein
MHGIGIPGGSSLLEALFFPLAVARFSLTVTVQLS